MFSGKFYLWRRAGMGALLTSAVIGAVVGLAHAQEMASSKAAQLKAAPSPRLQNATQVDWSAAIKQADGPQMQGAQAPSPQARGVAADKAAPRLRQAIRPVASRLSRDQVNRTRLPLLTPREGGMVRTERARLVSFGDAYSLNLPQDKGVVLTVTGNRRMVQAKRGEIARKPRLKLANIPEDVQITRLEDGWSASFRRFGVLYTVDLLCDDAQDVKCLDDAYLRKAVADMTDVSLGEEAQKEAGVAQ